MQSKNLDQSLQDALFLPGNLAGNVRKQHSYEHV